MKKGNATFDSHHCNCLPSGVDPGTIQAPSDETSYSHSSRNPYVPLWEPLGSVEPWIKMIWLGYEGRKSTNLRVIVVTGIHFSLARLSISQPPDLLFPWKRSVKSQYLFVITNVNLIRGYCYAPSSHILSAPLTQRGYRYRAQPWQILRLYPSLIIIHLYCDPQVMWSCG